jgi:hypothetical protein
MPNFVNILDQMQFERTGEITSGPIIVLDVQNGSKEPGAAIVLGPAHMQTRQLDSQLWEIQNSGQSDPFGNPFVFIINKNSGLELTSPNTPTGQSGIGLAVHQFHLKKSRKPDRKPASVAAFTARRSRWNQFNNQRPPRQRTRLSR